MNQSKPKQAERALQNVGCVMFPESSDHVGVGGWAASGSCSYSWLTLICRVGTLLSFLFNLALAEKYKWTPRSGGGQWWRRYHFFPKALNLPLGLSQWESISSRFNVFSFFVSSCSDWKVISFDGKEWIEKVRPHLCDSRHRTCNRNADCLAKPMHPVWGLRHLSAHATGCPCRATVLGSCGFPFSGWLQLEGLSPSHLFPRALLLHVLLLGESL